LRDARRGVRRAPDEVGPVGLGLRDLDRDRLRRDARPRDEDRRGRGPHDAAGRRDRSRMSAGLLAARDPLDHIPPLALAWKVGPVTLTNHLLMLGVAGILMLILFPIVARAKGTIPTGLRNLVESVLQFIRNEVARPSLHEATDRYVPFLWTVFFLI